MPLKKPIIITGALSLILLAVLAVIALLPKSEEAPDTTDTPVVQTMFDVNHIDHLESFSYRYQGEEAISITRTDGGWQITNRPGLPLDPEGVMLMLRAYEQILALRTVTENVSDLAEYGLDSPTLEVTLADHGTEKTYLFGDENKTYEGYYCTVKGSTAVYLLDVAYFTTFQTPMEDLLLTESLPDLSAASAIKWTSSAGVVADEVDSLKDALSSLAIDRLIDYGKEKFSAYGLDQAAIARITLAGGDSLTLRFAGGETNELIYLVIEDREIIYLVTCEDMGTLIEYIGLNNETDG